MDQQLEYHEDHKDDKDGHFYKLKELNEDEHFFIDQNILENSSFNWETNISISANRLFDTFAIIDNPFIIGP